MARRNKFGRTKAQQDVVDDLRAQGKVVPVGLFDRSLTKEQVIAAQEHKRSSAGSKHGDPRARFNGTGRTKRVGSRSTARAAAVRDF